MPPYRLFFGSVELSDELIVPVSTWRGSSRLGRSDADTLEPVLQLDDRPIAVVLYPRFRVRKVASDFMAFERWLFDLVSWADGEPRWLTITGPNRVIKLDYSYCKLISIDRPEPSDLFAGRWSDEVILTFQSDTIPKFY